MPYVSHTEAGVDAMLEVLGVDSIQALFSEIPAELLLARDLDVPPALTEMQLKRHMQQRAMKDADWQNFIGAGAYEHHIPAIVWELAGRGEFMTAYTPYQAEASQGILQLFYEYQTMMARLTGMEVSNASLYDGSTAVVEAILMAMRAQRRIKAHRILVPGNLNPLYRQVIDTLLAPTDVTIETIPFDPQTGKLDIERCGDAPLTAMIIAQPNFFGTLEEIDMLTDWAHAQQALVIAVTNPIALAILKPPGQWGEKGVDIVCGEGQPLGVPLSSGGPYFGFFCTQLAYVRHMPGRVVGQTRDADGNIAYTLTLQTREQHIRREKATSNICTNQGLAVTAATIYLSVMGPHGLQKVAQACHENTHDLYHQLLTIPGIESVFTPPFYHEVVVKIPHASDVSKQLQAHKMLPGLLLEDYFPEMQDCVLVCATETKTDEDIQAFVAQLQALVGEALAC